MKDFIQQAIRTESKPDAAMIQRLTQHVRGIHGYTGLGTEAGELADAFKKHIFYNKPLDRDNIKEELGDLFWYCAILLDEYGMGADFSDVMEAVIRKLRARYPDRFTEYDALNRNTDREMQAFTKQPREVDEDTIAEDFMRDNPDLQQRLTAVREHYAASDRDVRDYEDASRLSVPEPLDDSSEPDVTLLDGGD